MHRTFSPCGLLMLLAVPAALAQEKLDLKWRNTGPGGGGWIQSICASPHDVKALFVGCDVGGLFRSNDGGSSYTVSNIGLEDYFVECIAPHPRDANVLFIGCESGVYRSKDRGKTWQWLRNGFPKPDEHRFSAPIGALLIDASNPQTIYAGIGRPRFGKDGAAALYKSTDGGESWQKINAPGLLPEKANISDLLLDPRSPSHLYLACDGGLFQSTDGGVRWAKTTQGLPHDHVRRVALCRNKPDTLYLTLYATPSQKPWQGGVYKSADGGKTWSPCLEGLDKYVGKVGGAAQLTANYDRLVVHHSDPSTVYVGGNGWVNAQVYKTTDGGKNWNKTLRSPRTSKDPNTDPGWLTMWGMSIMSLAMSPLDPDLLYFGTSGHVMKTADGGRTWTNAYSKSLADGRFVGTGLEVTCSVSIQYHPAHPQRVYFGYMDIGLLISDDGGQTFRSAIEGVKPREMSNTCFGLAFDPADPSHCWGSFGCIPLHLGSIAESPDGGFTWTIIGSSASGLPDKPHWSLIVEPQSPASARRLYVTTEREGVFASEDGGKTWQDRTAGLPRKDVRDLVRHPTRPDTFWCAVAGEQQEPASLWLTGDGGKSWKKVGDVPNVSDVRKLAVAPGQPDRLYLAARSRYLAKKMFKGGVFRSDDGGANWKPVLEDKFAESLAVSPISADVIVAGLTDHPYHDRSTGGGVKISRDGGLTWRDANGDLPNHHASTLTLNPHDPQQMWVGTGGNGVFETRLDGR